LPPTDADAGQTLASVRIDSVPVNSGLLLNLWQWWQGKVVSAADAAKTIWASPALWNNNGSGYASFNFSVQIQRSAFDV
jgi:hypothetical protein